MKTGGTLENEGEFSNQANEGSEIGSKRKLACPLRKARKTRPSWGAARVLYI